MTRTFGRPSDSGTGSGSDTLVGSWAAAYTAAMVPESGLKDFDEMSVPEKILRLQDLCDQISSDPDQVELTDAQRTELERRLRAHREGSGTSARWSEIRQRIRDTR